MSKDKLYIEDILLLDINKLDSITLINYNTYCIYFAQKIFNDHIENINYIMSDLLDYLVWMSRTSSLLSKKIMQPKIHKDKNKNVIIRSSYIFCDKNIECQNFYGKAKSCNKHHYVHSLVKNDIDILISFMKNKIENNISFSNNDKLDIAISLKTLYFVFVHMATEANHISNTYDTFDIAHKNVMTPTNSGKNINNDCSTNRFNILSNDNA